MKGSTSHNRRLIGSLLLINFKYHTSGDGMQMKCLLTQISEHGKMNISKSFQVTCYLYSVNLYFQSFPFELKLRLGPCSTYTSVGHSNANWLPTTLHNFFFHPDLMNKFFLHPSSSSGREGSQTIYEAGNKVAEIGNFQLISLFVSPLKTIFVLGCCRCHKTSKMQVPPSFDIDSVGNGIYSFQKTCSSYLPLSDDDSGTSSSSEQRQSSGVTLSS